MKRCACLLLLLSLLLSGCNSWLDGSYVSVVPHEEQNNQIESQLQAVSSYSGLYRALKNMIRNGTESGLISVENYNQLVVARDMRLAAETIQVSDPFGAYAVQGIQFEVGTNAGKPAISVKIQYYHGRAEINNIKTTEVMSEAETEIARALDTCSSSLVLYIERYEERDLVQWVTDYATQYPHKVMELPQVSANLYPETGEQRIMELKFTYQTSREILRNMQSQVGRKFQDIGMRIRLAEDGKKHTMLYTYLTEQFTEFRNEISITPAYMLLTQGVGDSAAFATLFAAVYKQADIENYLVTGTRDGEPWHWNIILVDGVYYHVDILRSIREGQFQIYTDAELTGYSWDYSVYPACGVLPETPAEE